MAHAPGPWEYIPLIADGVIVKKSGRFEIRTDNYDVCTLIEHSGPIRKEDDARLIAAAPDLLAACKSAIEALIVPGDVGNFVPDAIRVLSEAIAKAEGAQ